MQQLDFHRELRLHVGKPTGNVHGGVDDRQYDDRAILGIAYQEAFLHPVEAERRM